MCYAPNPTCFPRPWNPGPWNPGPWNPGPWRPRPGTRQTQNLPDTNVGWRPHGCWGGHNVKGYGLDLDGDGRFTRGKDGVLAFDFDHDGKLSDAELERSNNMLKAYGGDYDTNGDGKVSWIERLVGQRNAADVRRMDKDGDGRLSSWELDQAGGQVWVDRDRDGRVDRGENHSVYDLPGGWGGRRLNFVDPHCNTSQTSPNWFRPPFLRGRFW